MPRTGDGIEVSQNMAEKQKISARLRNVVVAVKQVPDTTQVKVDPVTGTLVREGVPFIINPFDTHAWKKPPCG